MMANRRTAQMGREPIAQMGKLLKNGKVKGGAKQANRTEAYKRKEMEYSEKMYEESKRPKMDYKRAGEEARKGGSTFAEGGMVRGKKFLGTF